MKQSRNFFFQIATTAMPKSDPASPASGATPPAPTRILACVLCQQRKVKCDRKFPCAHCTKAGAICVPATNVGRQRRRRFPERQLLDQLRQYEKLLQENNIPFEALHSHDGDRGGGGSTAPRRNATEESAFETKDLWHAMNQISRPEDEGAESDYSGPDDEERSFPVEDIREAIVGKMLDGRQLDDPLYFGSARDASVNLASLHPEQVQIFRLWQTYLDNVNPLFKVTHTPTLQTRIIDAVANLSVIDANLEALLFSIYCIAIGSIEEQECIAMFGIPSLELLRLYRFGCQQALLKCNFMRTSNMDCLTALYLYMISVRHATDPRALSTLMGAVVRIAEKMNLHDETALSKLSPFEAEMRRRLWWSIAIFDNRLSEMVGSKSGILVPMWDCKPPHNINDFDIRPETKTLPPTIDTTTPTESLFAVVRAQIADFTRFSAFHHNFSNPLWKSVARATPRGLMETTEELVAFEKDIEEKYLSACDADIPLHFMTLWMTRSLLAKMRLSQYFTMVSSSAATTQVAPSDHDAAMQNAITMLQCDTRLLGSPLMTRFKWLSDFHFQFAAYVQLLGALRRRPLHELADTSWDVLSENFETRWHTLDWGDSLFFKIFPKAILKAWRSREAASRTFAERPKVPKIVAIMRQGESEPATSPETQGSSDSEVAMDLGSFMNIDDFLSNAGLFGSDDAHNKDENNLFGSMASNVDFSGTTTTANRNDGNYDIVDSPGW